MNRIRSTDYHHGSRENTMAMTIPEPDVNNVWRTETPGADGWLRSARPDADDKFFMISADGHVQEPRTFLSDRMPKEYHDRLPGVIVDAKGDQHQKTEGFRQAKLNWVQPLEGHEKLRHYSGRTPEARISDLAIDGCDAEILFPNKGHTIWATPDAQFSPTTTLLTTSSGPTTSPITKAHGPTRPRPSSGRWAISTTGSGPRSWD